ncbi:MAG: glycerophosphodiester phosphodiesterase family protein [Acidiferrobacterales bacterium]
MTIPQLVAHRGYSEHFPENTLIGIAAAIRAGARWVEIDVQLSADEVPVLLHDQNLQRVAGFKGTVHHLSYDQLYEIHPSEFERFGYRYAQVRIPTLAEFCELLQKWPGVTAFVELKSASIEHFGPAVVLNRVLRDIESVAGQVVLISFSFEILRAARKQGVATLGVILSKWSDRKATIVREIKPQYVHSNVNLLPRWGKLRVDNTKLVVYEIVKAKLAVDLAARGVDFVETFAIGEMFEQLEHLKGQSGA